MAPASFGVRVNMGGWGLLSYICSFRLAVPAQTLRCSGYLPTIVVMRLCSFAPRFIVLLAIEISGKRVWAERARKRVVGRWLASILSSPGLPQPPLPRRKTPKLEEQEDNVAHCQSRSARRRRSMFRQDTTRLRRCVCVCVVLVCIITGGYFTYVFLRDVVAHLPAVRRPLLRNYQ